MEARLVVKMEAGVDLKFYAVSYCLLIAPLYKKMKICLKKLACSFKVY